MDNVNEVLQLIELNESKEADARDYYYKLLAVIPEKYKDVINEIISDEIDHSIKLMRIAEALIRNKPAEYDKILNLGKVKNNDYPKVEKLEQKASYDEILKHIPRID